MTVKGVHPPLRRGLGAFFQSFDGLLPRCRLRRPKEESEGADDEELEVEKGYGGCRHIQLQIRKEGLKLCVSYEKPKDDDEVSSPP
jgi:hypothetical protein